MTRKQPPRPRHRCAIYTRKSSEEGLEQEFNSLDAQREACEAYIRSQRSEGWMLNAVPYDDGGFSGGNIERPGLARLIEDIKAGSVEIVVVYKVDRLSRSLADFVRLVELFDQQGVSFVSVTQQFNTSTSMGRLTLNVLLSFAQFEREVTGERIRDKIAASKRKGLWMGGVPPLGYDVQDRALVVNKDEARTVRHIYQRYLALGCVRTLKAELDQDGYVSKIRQCRGSLAGGKPFARGALYKILRNPLYIGKVSHHGTVHAGQHQAIIETSLWTKVQDQLERNRHRRSTRSSARDPSLLAGLLFDDNHNPMSPAHARKESRRYRYYVSQAVLQYKEQEAGSVSRVPAKTVEDAVTGALLKLLHNPGELLPGLGRHGLSATQQKHLVLAAENLADRWKSLPPSDQIDRLRRLIHRVTVGRQEITIQSSRSGVISQLLPDAAEVDARRDSSVDEFSISVAVSLKRCGLKTRLIVPNQAPVPANPTSAQAIQRALTQGLTWNQELLSGKIASVAALAKREKLCRRYVARIVRLAFLAPDIMQAIAHGKVPPALSLDRLKKGFPLDWQAQRATLGFSE